MKIKYFIKSLFSVFCVFVLCGALYSCGSSSSSSDDGGDDAATGGDMITLTGTVTTAASSASANLSALSRGNSQTRTSTQAATGNVDVHVIGTEETIGTATLAEDGTYTLNVERADLVGNSVEEIVTTYVYLENDISGIANLQELTITSDTATLIANASPETYLAFIDFRNLLEENGLTWSKALSMSSVTFVDPACFMMAAIQTWTPDAESTDSTAGSDIARIKEAAMATMAGGTGVYGDYGYSDTATALAALIGGENATFLNGIATDAATWSGKDASVYANMEDAVTTVGAYRDIIKNDIAAPTAVGFTGLASLNRAESSPGTDSMCYDADGDGSNLLLENTLATMDLMESNEETTFATLLGQQFGTTGIQAWMVTIKDKFYNESGSTFDFEGASLGIPFQGAFWSTTWVQQDFTNVIDVNAWHDVQGEVFDTFLGAMPTTVPDGMDTNDYFRTWAQGINEVYKDDPAVWTSDMAMQYGGAIGTIIGIDSFDYDSYATGATPIDWGTQLENIDDITGASYCINPTSQACLDWRNEQNMDTFVDNIFGGGGSPPPPSSPPPQGNSFTYMLTVNQGKVCSNIVAGSTTCTNSPPILSCLGVPNLEVSFGQGTCTATINNTAVQVCVLTPPVSTPSSFTINLNNNVCVFDMIKQ